MATAKTHPSGYTQKELDAALLMAAESGNAIACDFLLKAGSNIEARIVGAVDRPPLMLAAREGSVATCKLLIERGAEIDARDSMGNTALRHAAIMSKREAALFLISRGAHSENYMSYTGDGYELTVKNTKLQGMGMREAALRLGDIDCLSRLMEQPQQDKESESPAALGKIARTMKLKDVAAQLQSHCALQAVNEMLVQKPGRSKASR